MAEDRLVLLKNYLADQKVANSILSGFPATMPQVTRQGMLDRIRKTIGKLAKDKKFQKILETGTNGLRSIGDACVRVAELGLDPDPVFGFVYLVPYGATLQVLVGYRGYMELGYRSGRVKDFHMAVVWKEDFFRYRSGSTVELVHEPNLLVDHADDEKPVAAYAVADLIGGGQAHVVLSFYEIEKYRLRSAAVQASIKYKFSTPWDTDYPAMAMKTAIRRLAPRIPQSADAFRAAMIHDDDADPRERQQAPITATFTATEEPEQEPESQKIGLSETDFSAEQFLILRENARANRNMSKAQLIAFLASFPGSPEDAMKAMEQVTEKPKEE
jgi:phage RecT family recombinase